MSAFLQANLIQKITATVFVSMAPVVELRGGIPFGTALGLAPNVAMIAAVIGNLIPVPFIILFIRRIFQRMKRAQTLGRVAEYFEAKAEVRSEKVTRYRKFGLCIFVAVPLPGTGAWMGALIAALLGMKLGDSLAAIAAGVIIAGILVTGLTYGFVSLF